MSSDNGILVFLDRDLKAPQPALEKALRLARAAGQPVTVAVNSDSPAMRRAVGFDDARRESAERQIAKAWEKRIDELADGTAVTKRVAPHRDAETALRDTVVECAPSLVVVHTSEEGTLKRHLFTPRDWLLIRHAPCPVLCVHSQPWGTPPRFTAAVEPEEKPGGLDAAVIHTARYWSEQLHGELEAVHVLEHPDETLLLVAGEALPEYAASANSIREYHEKALAEFAKRENLPEEKTTLLEGPVTRTLTAYCEEEGADLLVVGTVRRNTVERLLLGATAESLLTRTGNDVLVVKPEDFESDWR
ncbi:universal stress protein [Alcanivorax sp. 521-1]|uniref:Universal stress protein n=1 Tax=Alloalcanivorax profundimaris TaxID=2735259 RepID=A0ABS0AWT6_9GAMM|nr:universal stress protein [Alloalcanivorax profundimaris]MBF5058425.1 universal stress protein [Alloalcanivorax profundimaris]